MRTRVRLPNPSIRHCSIGITDTRFDLITGETSVSSSEINFESNGPRSTLYEKMVDDSSPSVLPIKANRAISYVNTIKPTSREGYPLLARPISKNAGPAYQAKPCSHTKIKADLSDSTTIAATKTASGVLHSFAITGNGMSMLEYWGGLGPSDDYGSFIQGSLVGSHGTRSTPNWFALHDKFEENCDSFLPSEFLLGEDVIQYGIFADALKLVINPSRSISTFLRLANSVLSNKEKRGSLGHAARTVARASANGFLGYNFGVKPAIEDIQSALFAHRKVDRRLQYLSQASGKWLHVGASAQSTTEAVRQHPSTVFSEIYSLPGKGLSVSHVGCQAKVKRYVTHADYYRAYAQYFGLNKVVGLFWELVPFSFVADWFTNAGEYINKYTRIRLGGPFCEFRNYCCSTRSVSTDRVFISNGQMTFMDAAVVGGPYEIGSYTRSQYDRFLRLPASPSLFETSGLGLFHVLASSSLLIQKFWK